MDNVSRMNYICRLCNSRVLKFGNVNTQINYKCTGNCTNIMRDDVKCRKKEK